LLAAALPPATADLAPFGSDHFATARVAGAVAWLAGVAAARRRRPRGAVDADDAAKGDEKVDPSG
jgi:hypothetical protein